MLSMDYSNRILPLCSLKEFIHEKKLAEYKGCFSFQKAFMVNYSFQNNVHSADLNH